MSKQEHTPEILAPAGSREQLEAAVKSGADAVYFGASDFNARRNAENFSDADFLDAVRYCKIRGVKAYITLNTLITDPETEKLLRTLRLIAESGADAVIVQDLAVAALVKTHVPSLALHASTQMAVHNAAGALLLEKYGFSRIVLARELSMREIKAICDSVNAQIEVFVHGAHCMSVSGLCYLSSVFGGRSGNRGLCAQPCRLGFRNDLRAYTLSLKDLSLIPHLRPLADAGVCSFKIEGRMKRPEYVGAAVAACRDQLAGKTPDLETLKSVFSRSGFTDGYFTENVNGEMFGFRSKEDVVSAAQVLPTLRNLYKEEPKRVALHMRFLAKRGVPAALTLRDGENEITVFGETPQEAKTVPLTPERAGSALTKLGGTPYFCKDVASEIDAGLMLPNSALNALRREALEKLGEKRGGSAHPFKEGRSPAPALRPAPPAPRLRLRFQNIRQLFDRPEAEKIILDLFEILRFPEKAAAVLPKLTAELPVLIYPGEEAKTAEALQKIKAMGIREVLCENIGSIKLVSDAGLTPLGGMHLNILNATALAEYEKLGLSDNTLSFEMNFGDMKNCAAGGKTGYIAYGHLPLMRLRACPNRDESGCGNCEGRAEITDRRGDQFTLLCSRRRFSTLYNPIPLCATGFPPPKTDFATLYFTYEEKDACEKITADFLAGKKPDFPVTAGLYNKKLL